jgi:hypothetical protein
VAGTWPLEYSACFEHLSSVMIDKGHVISTLILELMASISFWQQQSNKAKTSNFMLMICFAKH